MIYAQRYLEILASGIELSTYLEIDENKDTVM